jgi:hypothetical protein
MNRWPPILWLMVFIGSLLILMGYSGSDADLRTLVPGLGLVVCALGLSLYLAFGARRDRPRDTGVSWLIPATVGFYVLCAIAASASGGAYAIAALTAGLIPLTAVMLLTATARAKTVGADDARRETTAAEPADPFPGVGVDDATPFGDTPEHSDAERVGKPDRR